MAFMKRQLTIILLLFSPLGFADYTLRDGKLVEREQLPTQSAQEHFASIMKYYEAKAWKNLEKEALVVLKNFSSTPFARDVSYFLAIAYFHQDEYELANQNLTEYLTKQATPKYFEEAIQCKFKIAEKFKDGARKHLMGFKSMPKWVPAGEEAVAIYDEVISALPHHDLAAHALYGKAQVQAKREDWRASIESYQTLIRRFPKHPLAVESYIGIGEVYLKESHEEYPDVDFIDLAEINLRKFKASFPGEEKIEVAVENFKKIQDHYAGSLFETARFYERTNKLGAAKIYYEKILKSYPDAKTYPYAEERYAIVSSKLAKIEAKKAKSKK